MVKKAKRNRGTYRYGLAAWRYRRTKYWHPDQIEDAIQESKRMFKELWK